MPHSVAKSNVQMQMQSHTLKIKRKVKANLEECDVLDAQVVKVEEKPTFVKNCIRNLNSAVALASATSRVQRPLSRSLKIRGTLWTGGRFILTAVRLLSS